MATLNVQATQISAAIETGNPATRTPAYWVATAADGAAPMGRWNLSDATEESVRAAVALQHGSHYDTILVSLTPL